MHFVFLHVGPNKSQPEMLVKSIRSQHPHCEITQCERSFNRNILVGKTANGDMDISEHAGKTMYEFHPYLAAFLHVKNPIFWSDCQLIMASLDQKYLQWYGDQEVLREIAHSKKYEKIGKIPESIAACLPEYFNPNNKPIFLHFKGKKRKKLMEEAFGLIDKTLI
jgi:hypothetical protein